jgi:polyphenol oxidase
MPLERACRKAGPFAHPVPGAFPSKIEAAMASQLPSAETELRSLDQSLDESGLARTRSRQPKTSQQAHPERLVRLTPDELVRLQRSVPACAIAANGVHWLRTPGWEKIGWLCHGFSTRIGGRSSVYAGGGLQGELNLGFTPEDDQVTVRRNRALLAEAVSGSADTPLKTIRQIHSNLIVVAGTAQVGNNPLPKADGLMTAEPGVLLGIQTADCTPVLVADRRRRIVAAFHAGWRGTVSRIVEAGIGRMRLEFGCRPEDLLAAIGPCIGPCCYAVGEEVLSAFESQFSYAGKLFFEIEKADPVRARYPTMFLNQRAPGHGLEPPRLLLDLVDANRRQLLAAGLTPRSIRIVGGCTGCHPELFFSHRASRGRTGRMMSVIGIRRPG